MIQFSDDPSLQSEIRNHCWSYFSLHAQQRISVFQYYVTLQSALFGVALFAIQNSSIQGLRPLAFVGLFIFILAFVFWKIDSRTRSLIKNAELSLLKIEKYFDQNWPNGFAELPFHNDPQNSPDGLKFLPLWSGTLSYTKSFNIIYFISGSAGLALSVWLLFLLKA